MSFLDGITYPELVVDPIESGHVFTPDTLNPRNDFYCSVCGRPRAMHKDDGFRVGELTVLPSPPPGGARVRMSRARFLPYTMSTGWQPLLVMVWLYLKLPCLWPLIGKQFLVVARKP